MIQIRFNLPTPLDDTAIKDITAALQKLDDKTILTSRNPTAGQISFNSPSAGDSDLDAFGELFKKWLQDPNPPILTYDMVLE